MEHGGKRAGLTARKYFFVSLLIAAIFASQGICFTARADTISPTVTLDGRLLSFSVAPRIINDRVMVPYRAIGEAMGASVIWDEASRKATLLLNDRYVILYTGNPTMYYGTHYVNTSTGETEYGSPQTTNLDAPPIIIEDYTFVPLRALTEGLGAYVEWNDSVKNVIIVSPPAPTPGVDTPSSGDTAADTPLNAPSVTGVPAPEVFEQTNWFQILSGARAQLMYENDEQFILVYYSSEDPVAEQYMPELKQTARNFGQRIYGVDARTDMPGSSDLSFIWNYSRVYSIAYPLVFFVNGKNDIDWIFGPSSKNELETKFDLFVYKSKFAPATPSPTPSWSGDTWNANAYSTPRPTPTPSPNLNTFWSSVDRSYIDNMFYTNQKFILVYYHSWDTDSQKWLDTVKEASVKAGVLVYGCDAYAYNEFESWWGKSYISNPSFFRYPTVFYVDRQIVMVDEQPTNTDALASTMRNFMIY